MMGNSALAFSQKHFGWQVKWQAETERERETRETLMRLANCQRGAQKVSIGWEAGWLGKGQKSPFDPLRSGFSGPLACGLSLVAVVHNVKMMLPLIDVHRKQKYSAATCDKSIECVCVSVNRRANYERKSGAICEHKSNNLLREFASNGVGDAAPSRVELDESPSSSPSPATANVKCEKHLRLVPAGNVTFAFAKALNESPLRLQL